MEGGGFNFIKMEWQELSIKTVFKEDISGLQINKRQIKVRFPN